MATASSRIYSPRDARPPGWPGTPGYLVARECSPQKTLERPADDMWALRLGGAAAGKVAVLSGEAIVCAIKQRKKRKQYIASVWVLFLLFREKKNDSEREELWPDFNFFSTQEGIIL